MTSFIVPLSPIPTLRSETSERSARSGSYRVPLDDRTPAIGQSPLIGDREVTLPTWPRAG